MTGGFRKISLIKFGGLIVAFYVNLVRVSNITTIGEKKLLQQKSQFYAR